MSVCRSMIHSEVRLWAIVSQPMATNMTIRSCPMSNPKPAIQRYATKTTNLDCRNRRSMTDRISMSSIILSDEYADARNLNEAIDMRGQKAFAQSVTPDDFRDASPDNMTNWVLPNCGPNRHAAPSFHWRVYTCRVTVYRQNLLETREG